MKQSLLIAFAVLVTLQLAASPVDVASARSAAQQFTREMVQSGRRSAPATGNASISLAHTELNSTDSNLALYYIFNTADSYIIIAGDDRAYEVLAYGDSPIDMNDLPDGMQYWLDCYKQDIEYLQAHPEYEVAAAVSTPHRAPSWGMTSVEPLLTAMWDQSAPYYNECPVSGGQHCLTGCAATSLSMICYFWKYPEEITTTFPSYFTESLNLYLSALGPTTFDWDNMKDSYRGGNYNSAQASAVAHLMRDVGQAEQMDYTPSASGVGAWDIDRAVKMLGFDSDAQMIFKENYTDEQWAALIQEELASGRPLEYCGFGGMSGHAFNVDGYDADRDMYHINWGWSGSSNGYFVLNGFRGGGTNYRIGQLMFINLEPPANGPTIKVRTTTLPIKGIAGRNSAASFTVKGAQLTSGVTLTLNDESGNFSLSSQYVSLSELQSGKTIWVTYHPQYSGTDIATVTLSSDGAEDKTLVIHGTAVLETYDPVLLDASDVQPSSFSISWQDRTPGHNVNCYRLECATAPYNELMLHEAFTECVQSSADCSSNLDAITSTPGWSGRKVYCGDGYLRVGNSSARGWIKTPALDMRENEGLVTVKVTARSAGTASESLLRISCGTSDTTVVTGSEESVYCVLLRCEPSDTATVRLSSRVLGQRVLLYDVEVYAGDDFSEVDLSTANYMDNISATSYLITGITPGSYALRVQARYSDGTVSPWSNRVLVRVNWARGDVNQDGEINIADVNTVIDVIQGTNNSRHTRLLSDLNGDGEVNVADINTLFDIIIRQ